MTILYTENVLESTFNFLDIFLMVCLFFFIIISIIVIAHYKEYLLGILFGVLAVLILNTLVLKFLNISETTYYYATFDDTVPFIDVVEEYDIVEQNGLIFKLKEKEIE